MFSVVITRKRDGYRNWVAGSVDSAYSMRSARELVRDMKKIVGPMPEVGLGVWENDHLLVLVQCSAGSVEISWKKDEWTREGIFGVRNDF